MRVAVVGAGAVGLSTAVALADADAEVTVYDRGDVAAGSTGRAAGICYDAFAEDRDAEIASSSLRTFRERGLLAEQPYVWVAREGDDSAADAIREQVPRMRAHGRDGALVDPADLGERYPQLRTDDVLAAAVARRAGLVDPAAYAEVLADELRGAGQTVETGTVVSLADPRTVATDEGSRTFDAVVVAAGPATAALVADVGASLALKAYRAQALVTSDCRATLPTYYDATEQIYWRPKGDGLLVGDGTHEVDVGAIAAAGESSTDAETAWNRDADDAFVASALDRVRDLTTLSPEADRAWAGLCTATPDRNPLLGAVAEGCYVATGWHGHGLMRSPAIGRRLAEQVLGGEGIDAYDPRRFDGDEEFPVVEGMTLDEEESV